MPNKNLLPLQLLILYHSRFNQIYHKKRKLAKYLEILQNDSIWKEILQNNVNWTESGQNDANKNEQLGS